MVTGWTGVHLNEVMILMLEFWVGLGAHDAIYLL